jgi:two-component system, NarL family, response regulator LiaR
MSAVKKIRIAIVDDHDVVRRGIKLFSEVYSDIELVGEAADGQEAIKLCERLQPDVVLMDIVMPKMDGVEATCIIHERWPYIRVIAFTSLRDESSAQRMLECGAVNYVPKDILIDNLAAIIRRAMAL